MISGFTGTRQGMTDRQKENFLTEFIYLKPKLFIHGGARGADEEAHILACELTLPLYIEVYPGDRNRQIYWEYYKDLTPVVFNWSQPLLRNNKIVSRCDLLIACPAEMEEIVRSGTWATVRYARKQNKPVTLILPDGIILRERQ